MIKKKISKKVTALVLSVVLSLGLTVTPLPFGDTYTTATVYAAETSTAADVTAQNVAKVNTYAAQLMNANSSKVGTTTGGFSWDTENKTRSWTYYNGLMMDAFAMLNPNNYSYIERFYNANISSTGTISNYGAGQLDSVEPLRGAFDLFMNSGYTSSNQAKYKLAINFVYNQLESQISYSQCGGNYAHKQETNGSLSSSWATYPIALDGIYMAQPFLMECANAIDAGKLTLTSKNGGIVSSATIYSAVYNRLNWIYNNLYNSKTHLYNHAANTSGGTNGVSWSRAIGWYAAALVDVIDMMPQGQFKESLISQLPRLFDGLIEYQDSTTGLWYNVTAYNTSLSNNKLETSGSSLFAYAMLKSYAKGWVTDQKYATSGLRAFNGVVNNKMTQSGGTYSVIDTYISSGASTKPSDYLTKSYTTNEAKGVGGLIMASTYATYVSNMYLTTITPPAPVLESISVTAPTKTEYNKGESLNLSGMTVVANYSNGNSENVTDYSVSALPSTAGTHAITVTYEGKTTTFNVTVHEASGNWIITEAASCQKTGQRVQYCKACDKVMISETIAKAAHTVITIPAVPATCTSDGKTEGSYCSVCNEVLHVQEDVPAKDHTLVTTPGVAPTCTEYGLSEKIYCSDCNTVIQKATLLPKASHTLVYTPAKEATCTEAGYTKSSYCTVCNQTIQAAKTVPIADHVSVVTKGYAATCKADGLTDEIKCSVCGEVLQAATVIPKGDHVPVTDPAVNATCTTAGKTEGSHCKVCMKVLVAQETIPATGHNSVTDRAVSATCTEPGRTKGSHCSTCGAVIRKSYTINPTGHTAETIKGTSPTCEAEGKTDGSRCKTCGLTLIEQVTIPANGHTEEIIPGYAATCTTAGKTDGVRCSVCLKTLTPQTSIAATGHTSVTDRAITATCTEPGRTKGSHCSTCGQVIRKSYTINPTGHKKGAMAADGKYYCTICGEEIIEEESLLDKIVDLLTN